MARRLRADARVWLAVALALAVAGCGDDDGAPTQGNVPVRSPPPPPPPKNPLAVKRHIEDRVACPPPGQPSDPKGGTCDPKAPSCGEHLYCLHLAQGDYCEPCPERDGIRHAFRERDFDPEHNRDPFQPPAGPSGPTASLRDPTEKCREDQLVASSYSYADLKLVGIVTRGTQRKVLMTMGKDGFIIKRGDCVGKEKAVVKDIGLGYLTFQGESGEHEVQLHPKQLLINGPVRSTPAQRTTPLPPPPVRPPGAPGAGSSVAPRAPGTAPTAPPAGVAPGTVPAPALPPAAKKP